SDSWSSRHATANEGKFAHLFELPNTDAPSLRTEAVSKYLSIRLYCSLPAYEIERLRLMERMGPEISASPTTFQSKISVVEFIKFMPSVFWRSCSKAWMSVACSR